MQRKLLVVALLVAAAGFIAQMVSGVTDTPTIPPGLVAVVVAAALAAFTSWVVGSLAGVPAGVFNLVALWASGRSIGSWRQPLLAFVGAWLMVLGLIVSCVTGISLPSRPIGEVWSRPVQP
jgi:hypothetical protein